MPLTYLIDGYNVLHHCSRLRPLARQSFEAARDSLIDRVARFCGITGNRARIVFDGRGTHADPAPHGIGGLEVVYAPAHQTADGYIEREVYQTAGRREVVVVTGDGGIRRLCQGLGALVMGPDNFLVTVDDCLEQQRDERRWLNAGQNGTVLEDRLSDASMRLLREARDLLGDRNKE